MKYYEVHVPVWGSDSKIGSFDTYEKALVCAHKYGQKYYHIDKERVEIDIITHFEFPFGWELKHTKTIKVRESQ